MNGGAAGRAPALGEGALAAADGADDRGAVGDAGGWSTGLALAAGAVNAGVRRGTTRAGRDPSSTGAGAGARDGGGAATGVAEAARGGAGAAEGACGEAGAEFGGGAALVAAAPGAAVVVAGRGAAVVVVACVGADGAVDAEAKSAGCSAPRAIVITPPQTEQRARTLVDGSLSGSTRKTERHSGQTTFMLSLPSTRQSPGR
jgi:hypothetical protein